MPLSRALEGGSAASPEDVLNGDLDQNTGFEVKCGNAPIHACILMNYMMAQALASLTGMVAFLPIFIVAVGAKMYPEDFPFILTDGHWLTSWPCIASLGVLLFFELLGDLIPGIAEMEDAAMLVIKPCVAIAIAISPVYSAEDDQELMMQAIAAFNAGLFSEIVALFKALETLAVDTMSGGFCGPVRSIISDIMVTAMTIFVLTVGGIAALAVLIFTVILVCGYCCYRWQNGQPLMPRCCRGGQDEDDYELEEDEEDAAEDVEVQNE
jgi:hypothetical protein